MGQLEFKGTEGAWSQSHREIPNDEDGMYATQVYDHKGETICTMSWFGSEPKTEVVDGVNKLVTTSLSPFNAKLISAAPDLLQALQSLRSHFTEMTIDESILLDEGDIEVLREVDEAIEKALK